MRKLIITGNWAEYVGEGNRMQKKPSDIDWYSIMKNFVSQDR